MQRFEVMAALCVLAVLCVSTSATSVDAKDSSYQVTFLKVPASAYDSWANSVNDAGRVAGGWWAWDDTLGWVQSAVVWDDPEEDALVLAGRSETDWTYAAAINDDGQVCGAGLDLATWHAYAALWDKDGAVTACHPDLGYDNSELVGENHFGDAVGVVYDDGGWQYAYVQPRDGDPYLLELDTTLYVQSYPYEVSKDGIVVGFARAASVPQVTHAAFWDEDGEMTDLHTALLDVFGDDLQGSKAWWVSDREEIGGVAAMWDGEVVPWVWTEADGFLFVDTDDYPQAAIWGGEGKYMVGLVNGSIQGWNWDGDVLAVPAVWERSTVKGQRVWALTQIPTPEGYAEGAAISANTSGAVVGVSLVEGAYYGDEYFGWIARR